MTPRQAVDAVRAAIDAGDDGPASLCALADALEELHGEPASWLAESLRKMARENAAHGQAGGYWRPAWDALARAWSWTDDRGGAPVAYSVKEYVMHHTFVRLRRADRGAEGRRYYRRKSCAYIDLAEAFVPSDAPRPSGGVIEPS
jgi:hypothetical protein